MIVTVNPFWAARVIVSDKELAIYQRLLHWHVQYRLNIFTTWPPVFCFFYLTWQQTTYEINRPGNGVRRIYELALKHREFEYVRCSQLNNEISGLTYSM